MTGWLARTVGGRGRAVVGHGATHSATGLTSRVDWQHELRPRSAASPWSPWGAPATRSTPRSSPGRLAAEGWLLVDDADDADVAVVNTCGFVEQAKKDSIDVLLEASARKGTGQTQKVVAVGLPRRALRQAAGRRAARGRRGARLRLLRRHVQRTCAPSWTARRRPRRTFPSDRRSAAARCRRPATAGPRCAARRLPTARPGRPSTAGPRRPWTSPSTGRSRRPGPRVIRARLDGRPWAPLKIASGCDRRCAFCAIPMFRGAFVSRRPHGHPRRGPLAGRAGRARAVPRQRELHVLRQGPRRPPPAREAAARAGRRRGDRAGAGVLPAAGRDPPRPARRDGVGARGGAVLRHLVPARLGPAAAVDAPVRRP